MPRATRRKTRWVYPRSAKSGKLQTYGEVVADYVRERRATWREEMDFFRSCFSFEQAVVYAAQCRTKAGTRSPHQYRVPNETLVELRTRLLTRVDELKKCKTFVELHESIADAAAGLDRIGKRTVYDVALHIGAYLGIEPTAVYLHGLMAFAAAALGFDLYAETLDPSELPAVFRKLDVAEIEDCLTLYVDDLRRIAKRRR